jgi:hypothetical protein
MRELSVVSFVAFAFVIAGCELGLSGAIAPTVDTSGHWGVEARIAGNASMGNEKAHARVALSNGGGYSSNSLGGYFVVSPEIGAQIGTFPSNQEAKPFVRGSFGALYSARFSPGPTVHHAVGGAIDVLFGSRGKGPILLGPRFQAEYIVGLASPQDRWLFSLPFVVKWIAADTPYAY